MKGIVFTSLLELIEESFGLETLDRIIEGSELPSGGAYTAVGTYDAAEILALVTTASRELNQPISEIVRWFGEQLFARLASFQPALIEHATDPLTVLESIDAVIHQEVRRLYPDAELPTFETSRPDDDTIVMRYRSSRPFADLAEGLIRGCFAHYETPLDLQRTGDEGGCSATFTARRIGTTT